MTRLCGVINGQSKVDPRNFGAGVLVHWLNPPLQPVPIGGDPVAGWELVQSLFANLSMNEDEGIYYFWLYNIINSIFGLASKVTDILVFKYGGLVTFVVSKFP